MKDFKNENEYGNMKLDETYECILLKTGDEGYRYYSSSNSSTSSTRSNSSGSSGGSGGSSNNGSGSSGGSGGSSNNGSGSSGSSGGSSNNGSGGSGGSGGSSNNGSGGSGSSGGSSNNGSGVSSSSSGSSGTFYAYVSSVNTSYLNKKNIVINATCLNATNMTVEVYGGGDIGRVIEESQEGDTITTAARSLDFGTYTVVIWAYLNNSELCTKSDIILIDSNFTGAEIGGESDGNDEDQIVFNADKILGSKRRILLLYAGPEYSASSNTSETNYTYAETDIQAVLDTGATEFVITTANAYNFDINGTPILSEIPFVSCSTSCSFDTVYNNCNQKEVYGDYFNSLGLTRENYKWEGIDDATAIKNLYKYIWGWWDDDNAESINPSAYYKASEGSSCANVYEENSDIKVFATVNKAIAASRKYSLSYAGYYERVVGLAGQLMSKDPNCKLWIGLPPIINDASFRAEEYTQPYIDLINKFKQSNIWGNVVGIYYGTEGVPGGYSAFNLSYGSSNTSMCAEDFNNAVVKNMRSIKSVLEDKLFLWIPYYNTDVSERIGHIVNRTDIFDVVILQTSYFFYAGEPSVDMDLVEDCVIYGKCLNHSISQNKEDYEEGVELLVNAAYVVGENVTSPTVTRKNIGFEVEMDSISGNLTSDNTSVKETRHNTFVNKFGKYINKTNVDVAFYAGTINDMLSSDLNIVENVRAFFENGTVAER